jgi:hypothetical protein
MEIDAMTWGKTGKDIAKQLEDLSDEQSIKAVAAKTMQAIHAKEGTPEKRANALKMLNRELLKKFPRKEEETKSYYHDPSGKADLPKWRHLIFKYLTLDSSDWDVVGGEAREVYKAQNPTKQPETTEPTSKHPSGNVLENQRSF